MEKKCGSIDCLCISHSGTIPTIRCTLQNEINKINALYPVVLPSVVRSNYAIRTNSNDEVAEIVWSHTFLSWHDRGTAESERKKSNMTNDEGESDIAGCVLENLVAFIKCVSAFSRPAKCRAPKGSVQMIPIGFYFCCAIRVSGWKRDEGQGLWQRMEKKQRRVEVIEFS